MGWFNTVKAYKLRRRDKSKIAVFDIETTGLNPVTDEILQVCILDGDGIEKFSSYIRPIHHKKWKSAEKKNGISPDMVKDAPTFNAVKKDIQKAFNETNLIVGYNVNFDISFLTNRGIVLPTSKFDVMYEFASYRSLVCKEIYRTCKLSECAEFFGIGFNPHTADGDASATADCFNRLIEDDTFVKLPKSEKQEKIEGTKKAEKRHTHFTLQFPSVKVNLLFLGIVFCCIAVIMYIWSNGIPLTAQMINTGLFYELLNSDGRYAVFIKALLLLGCVFIAIGAVILLWRVLLRIINIFRRIIQ